VIRRLHQGLLQAVSGEEAPLGFAHDGCVVPSLCIAVCLRSRIAQAACFCRRL